VRTPSASQRRTALEHANAIRLERARRMRAIRALPEDESFLAAARVLAEPLDESLETQSIEQFLRNIHRVGVSRAGTILNAVGVNPTRPLGRLTQRQRRMLIAELQKAAARWRARRRR
jgi:hypothetical protein